MDFKNVEIDIDISAVIRRWIEDSGKNQKEMAEIMGLSPQNLSHHLKRRVPTIEFIMIACKALRKYPWEVWIPRHELEKALEKQMDIPYEYLEPSVIVYNMPPPTREKVLRLIADVLDNIVIILGHERDNS